MPSVGFIPMMVEGGPITLPNAFEQTAAWPRDSWEFNYYQCSSNPVRVGVRVSAPVIFEIAQSPSRLTLPLSPPLVLAQVKTTDITQKRPGASDSAHCDLLTKIELDLRRLALVPKDVSASSGDWYMIEMVDAHERLHITHHSEAFTRIFKVFTDRLGLLSADSEDHLKPQVLNLLDAFFKHTDTSEWGRWAVDEGNHQPDPNLFTLAELGAAQPIFVAIAAKRTELRCGASGGTDVVYRYLGNRFTSFSCDPLPGGGGTQACATPKPGQSSYTPNDFVSLELSVHQRLPPNVQRVPLCVALEATACRYELTTGDGHQPPLSAINDRNAAITISTDAQSNIIAPWQITLYGAPPSQRSISTLINDTGSDLDGGWLRQDDFGRVVGRRGTWSLIPR